MAARRSRVPLLLVLAFVFMGLPSLVEFYTDWLWFGELGYQHVFARAISTKTGLAGIVFLLTASLILGNLLVAFRSMTRREIVMATPEGPRVLVVEPGQLRSIVFVVAAFGGLALAAYAGSHWEDWLLYRHATPFNQADPILGYDVSFYLFTLPVLQIARSVALLALIPAMIGTAVVYAAAGRVGISPTRGVFADPQVITHLAVLAAGVFLMLAAGAWLQVPSLLTSSQGFLNGASYTDVHARMPALRVLAAVGVIGAVLAIVQALQRKLWPIAAAVALYFVVSVGGSLYAAAIQRFVVAPNEQVKETPFIVHNIAATRAAFALNDVEEREISGDALLTRADIDRNDITLKNVPLWDHQPLLDTFSQLQEIRTYYDFVSVDNDRYMINGEYRQIMLSARELNSDSLQNRTWINEHLTFTHGYGLTLGPVNQATPEGLPTLFIRNLPVESQVDLKVEEASLYFGELSNDYVFVKTSTNEFHYPKGDDNVTATYQGRGGVGIGSLWRKLLFSIRFRSLKTLLSNDLTTDSRILFHRRISDRVELIAPFLTYDTDPYLAIDKGRLFWVQDAYTTSNRYPYATPAGAQGRGGVNYIRNSIKAVIDTYHGTTTFYRVDEKDPVAATIDKAFPGLLRPFSEMPEGLRTRLRYPQTIFALQANMFSTYHMDNPAVFYNKEDQWEIPTVGVGNQTQQQRMEPYYSIMRLPGETQAEFIQMLPFTPRQKDNLAAWMVARSDGERYGRLMVFRFPKQKVIFGPKQVNARISQDQIISPQITLWNQQGSEVIQGTLLVIPIEESLMYVRALYLRASGGKIPELKRVIVVYQNQIVMTESLEAAIDRIFPRSGARPSEMTSAAPTGPGGASGATASGASASPGGAGAGPLEASGAGAPSGDLATLAARAQTHYDQAIKAQRDGDWARYGEELKKLGAIIDQMRKTR
jgi:uncharacterized membrane protein (UPF0182 family)